MTRNLFYVSALALMLQLPAMGNAYATPVPFPDPPTPAQQKCINQWNTDNTSCKNSYDLMTFTCDLIPIFYIYYTRQQCMTSAANALSSCYQKADTAYNNCIGAQLPF